MKYKVGDKVRIRKDLKSKRADGSYEDYGIAVNKDMEKLAGKVVTIKCVNERLYTIEEYSYVWTDKMFEDYADEGYAGKPSKEELFNMPMGTKIITDKGCKYVYDKENFAKQDALIDNYDIDDNLNLTNDSYYGTKIVEVQIPEYKTVWKEAPRKMTLKEIEALVGYPVEIVEEEN